MSFGEEGIDDPSDFQANAFQDLDEHFRCPICKEFFETTMILSTCSHSFCALCIRRSLNTEQNCPQCRKAAYENDLIHNYALDHVVNTWKNNRMFILTADRNAHAPPTTSTPIQNEHIQHNLQTPPPPPISYNSSHSLPIIIDNDTSDDFVPAHVKRSKSVQPTTRRSNRLSSQTTTQDKGKGVEVITDSYSDNAVHASSVSVNETLPRTQYQSTTEQVVVPPENGPLKDLSLVECPICTQHMAMIVINQHIDNCMKGDSRIPPLPTGASSSKPTTSALSNLMPQKNKTIDLGRKPSKVVYALMKDKELKQALKDLGLSDQGDKATRIWRHKEYINLYNANYDSEKPVSASVLIQRLNMTEQLKMNDKYNQLKRKATDLDEHKQLYKSQFQELTESAKRNRLAKKSKESSSQDDNSSTPAT